MCGCPPVFLPFCYFGQGEREWRENKNANRPTKANDARKEEEADRSPFLWKRCDRSLRPRCREQQGRAAKAPGREERAQSRKHLHVFGVTSRRRHVSVGVSQGAADPTRLRGWGGVTTQPGHTGSPSHMAKKPEEAQPRAHLQGCLQTQLRGPGPGPGAGDRRRVPVPVYKVARTAPQAW